MQGRMEEWTLNGIHVSVWLICAFVIISNCWFLRYLWNKMIHQPLSYHWIVWNLCIHNWMTSTQWKFISAWVFGVKKLEWYDVVGIAVVIMYWCPYSDAQLWIYTWITHAWPQLYPNWDQALIIDWYTNQLGVMLKQDINMGWSSLWQIKFACGIEFLVVISNGTENQ